MVGGGGQEGCEAVIPYSRTQIKRYRNGENICIHKGVVWWEPNETLGGRGRNAITIKRGMRRGYKQPATKTNNLQTDSNSQRFGVP
jgi:hypothetical protein